MTGPGEVTRLLAAYREGDREAFDQLVPLVYDDLRRIARAHLRGRRGQSLDTVGLVNEAWLRLAESSRAEWECREHFLSVCARAMRQIVISGARRRAAAKRGAGARPVTLEEDRVAGPERAEWLLSLDGALERLAARSERLARVVECRFFAGFGEQETAEALGVSLRTVQRDWVRARAWLRQDLGAAPGGSARIDDV